MVNMYFKKQELLESLEKKKLDVKKMRLYSFVKGGAYRFVSFKAAGSVFKNIDANNTFIEENGYSINEIIESGMPRKPYLDIEKIFKNKKSYEKSRNCILDRVIKDIIKVFKIKYNTKIKRKHIYLTEASGKVNNGFKLSFHVVVNCGMYYTDSRYSDSSAIHFYTSMIEMDKDGSKEYDEIIDGAVYARAQNMRIIGAVKSKDDRRALYPVCSKTYEQININDVERKDYLIVATPNEDWEKINTPVLEQASKSKKTVRVGKPSTTDVNEELLKVVKKYHPTAYQCGKTEMSYGICYNFNYENRDEVCPLGHIIHEGSNGFFVVENDKGFYLKCHSRKCAKAKGIRLEMGDIDVFRFENEGDTKINAQYLLKDEIVNEKIDEWLEDDDYKVMCVKSPMGTGKTYMMGNIIEENSDEFKRILWITHRITLTKQIYGSFKKYGFETYLDKKGNLGDADRIIVQLDSLQRLFTTEVTEEGCEISIPKYDLVVIDECESLFNHFSSPYLDKGQDGGRSLFNEMMACIKYAPKVIFMDADMGERTHCVISSMKKKKVQRIINSYKPSERKFNISCELKGWLGSIKKDIEEKKKLCIVSMGSNVLSVVEDMISTIKGEVKYVKHTSQTDDRLKKEIENVNEYWKKFQVVMYSPTIESGVDFSVEHFDKMYCYLLSGNKTTSQRGFIQMTGRIRKLKCNTIECYLDKRNSQSSENQYLYTFNDVLSYLKYYEKLNGITIIKNTIDEVVERDNKIVLLKKKRPIDLFDMIQIINETESMNKGSSMFLTVLKRIIISKGFKVTLKSLPETKLHLDKFPVKREILLHQMDLVDETEYSIGDLQEKQRKSALSDEEKIVLTKQYFLIEMGISLEENDMKEKVRDEKGKKVTREAPDKKNVPMTKFYELANEFYEEYKESTVFTKMYLRDEEEEEEEAETEKSLRNAKYQTMQNIVTDMVNLFHKRNRKTHLTPENVSLTLQPKEYKERLLDIYKKSIYFQNQEANGALFFNKATILDIPELVETPSGISTVTQVIKRILAKMYVTLTSERVRVGRPNSGLVTRAGQAQRGNDRKYVRKLKIDENMLNIAKTKKDIKDKKKAQNDVDIEALECLD